MKWYPTGLQMKQADQFTIEHIGIPSMVLMERAALRVVEALYEKQLDLSNVLVVCGAGNNGGDGYAIARLLHQKGITVQTLFLGNDTLRSVENLAQKKILEHYPIKEVTEFDTKEYSLIIDAIFGTGISRDISGRFYEVIDQINHSSAKIVSVDIPSGIHDTTGEVMGIAVKADLTVAIAYIKRGVMLPPGFLYAGEITVGEIGIGADTFQETMSTYGYEREDLKALYPKRKPHSHKGSYGRALLITGSKGMSGAAYLSAKAAYEMGAGLVRIYTHEDNRVILQQLLPEAIVTTYETYNELELRNLLEWADVVGIGSGLGQSDVSEQLVHGVLKYNQTVSILDADALNILSNHMEWLQDVKHELVVTPHMKEMSRLLHCSVKDILEQRVERLQSFVEQYPFTCVMKDSRTLVAKKTNNIYLNSSGNSAMAKGGSGDVLTGVITGIVAQAMDPFLAATLGVYLHGLAGDEAKLRKGCYSVSASDMIECMSEVLKKI